MWALAWEQVRPLDSYVGTTPLPLQACKRPEPSHCDGYADPFVSLQCTSKVSAIFV